MSLARDLYQEIILDHNKNPRNFRKLEHADHLAVGHNPLCGDKVTVFVKLNGEVVEDVSFDGSGCAISKASASLMTTVMKGKTLAAAKDAFESFHQMVNGTQEGALDEEKLGKLAVFAGVSEFPARVKCASLAWHTFMAALEAKREPVSTE